MGVKPKAAGGHPMSGGVSYQRLFDENRYEVQERKQIKVEPEATYLVEDVFLIHSDGRLIAHHSRKFRDEIDEDIFSGMLTVVQDFGKDSFRARTKTGMKRLDFGDSKILIERSPHTFLAAVVVGQEPKLLPLYMLQVLKEVEDRYGTVLEKWTGLLHQLEGIDDAIKKLVLVAKDPSAEMGPLAESPVTLTARVIEALGTNEALEANELMAKAQSTLETDIQLAWQFIEKARGQAVQVQGQLKDRMGDILKAARDTVAQMKEIGADTSQAELLLRESEEAFHEGKYERVREIQLGLHESLERQKGEIAGKKVEVELASLINDIQIAKSQGLDPREAESYLTKIEGAIQKKNHRQIEDYLRRAKESLARQRRRTVLEKSRENIARLHAMLAQAKAIHADFGDIEELVAKADQAFQQEDLRSLEALIERADATAKARVEQILKDRNPRLFLETSNAGLQANHWTRIDLQITNKGNWPAERVTPIVSGPVDVAGLEGIDRIRPAAQGGRHDGPRLRGPLRAAPGRREAPDDGHRGRPRRGRRRLPDRGRVPLPFHGRHHCPRGQGLPADGGIGEGREPRESGEGLREQGVPRRRQGHPAREGRQRPRGRDPGAACLRRRRRAREGACDPPALCDPDPQGDPRCLRRATRSVDRRSRGTPRDPGPPAEAGLRHGPRRRLPRTPGGFTGQQDPGPQRTWPPRGRRPGGLPPMGAEDDRATWIRRRTGGAEAHYRRDRGADGGDFPSDPAGDPGVERSRDAPDHGRPGQYLRRFPPKVLGSRVRGEAAGGHRAILARRPDRREDDGPARL